MQNRGIVASVGVDRTTAIEIRHRLVSAVFPELRYGDDPDLDRYLELRKDGRVSDALAVYNGALRSRYPSDGDRALLIAMKRLRDPRWTALQSRLLDALADRIEARVAANSAAILDATGRAGSRDAWGSLGAVEAILSRFGSQNSTDIAIAAVEQHLRLARLIEEGDSKWRSIVRGLDRALRLLEEYAALSNFESPDAQDFVARSRAIEERKRTMARPRAFVASADDSIDFVASSRARERSRKREKENRHRFFDLERIRFTTEERAAIELDALPPRHEDIVIAWCAKYWRASLDPRFERTVFLFSSKYRTRHFEILRELRMARLMRRSDDEILTALSSLLSTGYSYSVTGDIYMQRRWSAVKAGLSQAVTDPTVRTIAPSAHAAKKIRTVKHVAPPATTPPPRARSSAQVAVARHGTASAHRIAESKARLSSGDPRAARQYVAESSKAPFSRSAETRRSPALLRRRSAGPIALERPTTSAEPVRKLDLPATGSISDRIRRLSGRQYDVYRNIFLEKVRDSIRRALLGSKTKISGIFDTGMNDAEDAIFGFIAAHYEDPFMDWPSSRERSFVESLGFSLASLDGIVDDCYRRL